MIVVLFTCHNTSRRLDCRHTLISGLDRDGVSANPSVLQSRLIVYLVLEVVLPIPETERAKELYQTMARELAFNPRRALGV